MSLSKLLSEAASGLHTIAAHLGMSGVAPPWPVGSDEQAEMLAAIVRDMARYIGELPPAVESPVAKLAAQVAALEPLVLRMTEGLDAGSPWPRAEPIESLRAGLLAVETERNRLDRECDQLRTENIRLTKAATRAFVDESRACTLAARAQYEAAECRVQAALLDERLATAIFRGHLPPSFRDDLVEWSK